MDADWGSSSDEEESALRKEKEEAKRKETMVNRAPIFVLAVCACDQRHSPRSPGANETRQGLSAAPAATVSRGIPLGKWR